MVVVVIILYLVQLLLWVEEKVKVFVFNRFFWKSCIPDYDDVFCWWSSSIYVWWSIYGFLYFEVV